MRQQDLPLSKVLFLRISAFQHVIALHLEGGQYDQQETLRKLISAEGVPTPSKKK